MQPFHALSPAELDRFFQRSRASSPLSDDAEVDKLFREVLAKAMELVPAEAGAVLLDDPLTKAPDPAANELHCVAAVGPAAATRVGRAVSANVGAAGWAYRTSAPYRCVGSEGAKGPSGDGDAVVVRDIIAAPIIIRESVCGALELTDRLDGKGFDEHDVVLLQVFASYTASSLQNALDARHARELAQVDDLTGLYNDRYLHVRLREELSRSDPCALMFIDLDQFKPVNDTYGHLVGSQVLREIGYLLRRVTADQSAVTARYGGDEFTVLLPGRSAEQAAGLAEDVRAAIADAVFLDRDRGLDLPALKLRNAVTASIGVADASGTRGTVEERVRSLLRRADRAMYAAKEAGRDRVWVARADGDSTPPLAGRG